MTQPPSELRSQVTSPHRASTTCPDRKQARVLGFPFGPQCGSHLTLRWDSGSDRWSQQQLQGSLSLRRPVLAAEPCLEPSILPPPPAAGHLWFPLEPANHPPGSGTLSC